MSQYLPEPQKQSTVPKKGPDSYLSAEERAFLTRYLSHPEELPDRFKAWLLDYVAVNIPQIPVSQIVGYQSDRQATRVQKSSQTIPSGTQTEVTFDEVVFDAAELWPGSGSELLTPKVPGVYHVTATGQWHTQTGGIRALILKTSSGIVWGRQDVEATTNLQAPYQTVNALMRITTGQSIQLDSFQNSGSDVNLLGATLSAALVNRFI